MTGPSPVGAFGRQVALSAALLWLLYAFELPRLLHAYHVPETGRETVAALAWGAALFTAFGGAQMALAQGLGRVTRRSVGHGALALLGTALFLALFIDCEVSATQAVHLYSAATRRALNNPDPNREMHLSPVLWSTLGAICLTTALVHGFAAWILARRPPSPSRVGRGLLATGVFGVAAFVIAAPGAFSLADPIGTALPLFELILPARRTAEDYAVLYPPADAPLPTMTRRPDILLVAVESLRADVFNDETMPELRRFVSHHRCIASERHFSGGHVTEQGIFSLFYGLDAYHLLPFLAQSTPSMALKTLRHNGYRLVGGSGSALRHWNGAGLMVDQLDVYDEPWDPDPAERDRMIVDVVLQDTGTGPYFRFLFFDSTHFDYHAPPDNAPFQPAERPDLVKVIGRDRLQDERPALWNQYRNAVHWVDVQLGRLLAAPAPGRFVVVVGDHGEEFWEGGMLGHSGSNFVNSRIEVPLVLCLPDDDPGSGLALPHIERSSHVDVLPTIFDYAGVEIPTDGRSLLRPQTPEAAAVPVLVSGIGLPVDAGEVCLIGPETKTWLTLAPGPAGTSTLYTRRVTDLDDHPLDVSTGPADPATVAFFERRFSRFLR